MCIICQIMAEKEEATRKGEIGIATAADSGQATSPLQVDQDKASINVNNAEAVRKLAHAAQILDDINEGEAAQGVVKLIKKLTSVVEPEPEPANPLDVVMKFSGATGTGKSYLSNLVLRALAKEGFAVQPDEENIDSIVVTDPATSIRNRQPGSNPVSPEARNDRINDLLAQLEAEGVVLLRN